MRPRLTEPKKITLTKCLAADGISFAHYPVSVLKIFLTAEKTHQMKRDDEVRDELESQLDSEPRINAARLSVAVKDGIVALRGHVSSVAEKELAESAAQRLSGVRALANEVEVVPPGSTTRTGHEIAEACVNALDARCIGVLDEKIKIVVSNGWVTASGQVSWQFVKDAALKAIRELAGVTKIIDNITIKPRVLSCNTEAHGRGNVFEAIVPIEHRTCRCFQRN
jgi:osmotically-inducible protein OsmY